MSVSRIIKRTVYTGIATGTAFAGYIAGTTSVICPLPLDDPLWSSSVYSRFNVHNNPSAQDVCIKRIPLSKIRPELLENEGDLALEFCRGVWSGWGESMPTSQTPSASTNISSPPVGSVNKNADQGGATTKQATNCNVASSPRSTRP